jgi:fatty-acyl-CoA synthase
VREFCRAQIAHFKVPRYVRFMDALPLTLSGKVQKYLIRERFRAELDLMEDHGITFCGPVSSKLDSG